MSLVRAKERGLKIANTLYFSHFLLPSILLYGLIWHLFRLFYLYLLFLCRRSSCPNLELMIHLPLSTFFPSSPLKAAYSSIALMTHFPLCNFFFSHFPCGLMARCSFYLLFLLSCELIYDSSLRSSRKTHKLNWRNLPSVNISNRRIP